MNTTAQGPGHPPPDCSAIVTRHQSYRGLQVQQNLLSAFTMYVVDLSQFGLFISDSRPAAFRMAFEALSTPTPQALAA